MLGVHEIAPSRPALRWHGGKWKLAPWIIEHFPPHRIYVEPFGGAASVLLRKTRSYAEVYNDLDGWVVNLFRVLQNDATAARLRRLLELTPFARAEFELARDLEDDIGDVELARRLIIRAFMGFGSNAHNGRATGFRANSNRSGSTPAGDWANYSDLIPQLTTRLRGVVIERRDAAAVMVCHDSRSTLHYVDPPYLPETRSPANKSDLKFRMYRHEMTAEHHVALLEMLPTLEGMVVLSGYASPLYESHLGSWNRVERKSYADGARERTEVLWINDAAWSQLHTGLLV